MLSMYFYLNSFLGILFAAQCSTTYTKEKTTYVNSYGLVIKFVAVTLALLTKQSLKRLFYKENAILTIKKIGILTGLSNLVLSFIGYFLYKSNTLQFQFVQQYDSLDLIIRNLPLDFFLGIDGSSIFFIILTGIIMPIAIISNWKSITDNSKSYILIMLLLEMLLITVFLVLDTLSFYIFFESILPPLFLLVGFFGSDNKVVAGYYLFLYTLLGSLFMLLSILSVSSLYGVSDYSALFKTKVAYISQTLLFVGIFIAFAVKTPTIFLNIWLLKAHVESPLGGSIILAAIVLKLSLYGIVRLILPILPKITLFFTSLVFSIAVITILYASVSTLRTVDIKELIAYSSVSHAAVYLLGMFSNTITGIKGAIILGLAHGFVSSGLFICVGGVLYDRSSTRLISSYKGMTQLMPLFSILFFILCLGNSGTPLTLNFIGEFMCLYGSFEKLPIAGAIACSSIVFSAAYTIYMYNRIAFGGSYSDIFKVNFIDLTKREFVLLTLLVVPTVILGIYPSCITDCLSFGLSSLIYNTPNFTLDNISSNIVYTASLFGISTSKKLAKKFSNKRSFKSTAVNKINELPSPPSSTHSAVSGDSVNSDINTFTTIREFVQYHADRLDTRLADYVIEYGNLRIDPTIRASLDHYWNNITHQIETIIETIERLRETGTGLSEARNMSRIIEDLYDDSQGGLQNILRQGMEEIARQSQAAASQAGPSQSDVSEAVSETVSEAVPSNAGPSSILKEKFLKDNPFNKKDSSATQEVDQDDELYTSPLKRKRSSDDESDFEYEGKGKRPRNNNDGPNRGDGNSGSDGPSGPSTGGDSGASGGDIGSGGDMGSGGGTTSSRSIHDFSLDENEFLTDTDLYYFPTDFNIEQFIGYLDLNLFSKLLEILPSFTSVVYLL